MYSTIKEYLSTHNVQLVAVSKTRSQDQIMKLYHQGQRDFGENRVAELLEKYKALPKDIRWHMIGHLQSKKVKSIAPFIYMIHSVDSMKLMDVIEKEATKVNNFIKVLLQIKVAQEDTKYGLSEIALESILTKYQNIESNVEISGLMGMATNTMNRDQIKKEFLLIKNLFEQSKTKFEYLGQDFKELSMGMSNDYDIAVAAGTTIVRIGSLLF